VSGGSDTAWTASDRSRSSSLRLRSGRVVAGDPYLLDDRDDEFVQQVPPGRYPLVLVVAVYGRRGHLRQHETIAAARLVIRDEPVFSWGMAAREGQGVFELDEEFFGCSVGGGIEGPVDTTNIAPLCEDNDACLDRLGALRGGETDTMPGTVTDEEGMPLVVVFPSEDRDGRYPTWVGRTSGGGVACFLTGFLILKDDEIVGDNGDGEPRSTDEAGYASCDFTPRHELRNRTHAAASGAHVAVRALHARPPKRRNPRVPQQRGPRRRVVRRHPQEWIRPLHAEGGRRLCRLRNAGPCRVVRPDFDLQFQPQPTRPRSTTEHGLATKSDWSSPCPRTT
jgi:hypothetical protein